MRLHNTLGYLGTEWKQVFHWLNLFGQYSYHHSCTHEPVLSNIMQVSNIIFNIQQRMAKTSQKLSALYSAPVWRIHSLMCQPCTRNVLYTATYRRELWALQLNFDMLAIGTFFIFLTTKLTIACFLLLITWFLWHVVHRKCWQSIQNFVAYVTVHSLKRWMITLLVLSEMN